MRTAVNSELNMDQNNSDTAAGREGFKYYLDAGEGPSTIKWLIHDVDITQTMVKVDYLRIQGEEDFVFINSCENELKTLNFWKFEVVPSGTEGEYQLYYYATIQVPFDVFKKYPDEILFSSGSVEVVLKFYHKQKLLKNSFDPIEEGKIDLHKI